MAEKLTVLFISVGRRVSLLEAFRGAAEELQIEARILGADCSPLSPAFHTTDASFLVPRVQQEDFIPALMDICKAENVDLLIPLTDWELTIMSQQQEEFGKLGTRVAISSAEVIDICHDKEKTYEFLVAHGFDTPQIFTYSRARKGPFPLFMKPRHGSSAKDIHFLRSRSALEFYRRSSKQSVIQEFISGEEFTIDVFADSSGKARCAVPRKRLEVRAGEVSKSLTVRHEEIIAQSVRLVEELKGCFGAITIQCFLTPEGQIKFIEINPRFGGGIPLAFRAGANYPKWLLQMQLGQEPDFDAGAWQDGLFMLRYDEAIFKTQDEVQG